MFFFVSSHTENYNLAIY